MTLNLLGLVTATVTFTMALIKIPKFWMSNMPPVLSRCRFDSYTPTSFTVGF